MQNRNLSGRAAGTLRQLIAVAAGVVFCGMLVPDCAAKKPVKPISTPDGRPIRKVYIRTASAQTANSVREDLEQDTCITPVTDENQADAVLDVSMILAGAVGGPPMPSVFVPSITAPTQRDSKNGHVHSTSVTCSDSGESGGCVPSNNTQGGELGEDLPRGFARTGGSGVDVSLISTGKASQQLWEPESRSKRPWADQLRRAVGCPVCPGKQFRRRKQRTYRAWIQEECPGVLESGAK